jgi:Spy/CpxP family protein refolding chaperone
MKRPFATACGLGLALALSASAAVAQGPGQGGPGRRMQALMNGITLTAEQQARVDSIVAAFRAQMPPFTPGSPPDSATMARRRELIRQQDDAIRAVLTPEQQTVFDRNREQLPTMPRRPGGPGR